VAKKKPKKEEEASGPNLDHMADEIDKFLASGDEELAAAATKPVDAGGDQPPPPQGVEEEQLPPEPGADPDSPEEDAETEASDKPAPALKLALSDDLMQVSAETIHPQTTVEELLETLASSGIQHGVVEADIRRTVRTVQDSGKALKDAVLAVGTPPKAPEPSLVDYSPPEGVDSFPSLAPIRKLLQIQSPREFREAAKEIKAVAVCPGDILGTRVVGKGTPGTNVMGEEVAPPLVDDASNTQLQPGDGVSLDDTHTSYSARHYGYGGILEGRLTVLSPLWHSADSMASCYVHLTPMPGSTPPGNDDLRNMLSEAGIAVGIQENALKAICEKLYNGDAIAPLAVIAKGEAPSPPTDAKVTFSFPHKPQAGAVRADGSIDFRERNVFPAVEKDAVLIEATRPQPGQPGKDVFGNEVAVVPPVDVELVGAEGVRLEDEDGGARKLIADIAGGASAQEQEAQSGDAKLIRYTVAVRPVAQIPADVDYSTGNIDFKGNVEVKGAIKPGFSVTATGDVTVAGGIEDGAEVDAGGELKIQLGILGSKTRVVVEGNITAKFIQEATVKAGSDILIGSYIHGGQGAVWRACEGGGERRIGRRHYRR